MTGRNGRITFSAPMMVIPPTGTGSRATGSLQLRFTLLAAGIALVLFAVAFLAHERRAGEERTVPDLMEVRLRTEPMGMPVALDGTPVTGERLRFAPDPRRGELVATLRCRKVVHRLEPSDAGGEVVLVADPPEVELPVGPEGAGARVTLNGSEMGASPARLRLDLCRENRIEVLAGGFRPGRVTLPAGVTPLEARTAVEGIRMERPSPGRILLPELPTGVRVTLDGKPVPRSSGGIEVVEGRHEVRARSEAGWIDASAIVEVPPNGSVVASLPIPAMATIQVQAFPSNCQVYLRTEGSGWRYMDDTPAHLRVAEGIYRMRVEHRSSGQTEERDVRLIPGTNPPLRFGFGIRR